MCLSPFYFYPSSICFSQLCHSSFCFNKLLPSHFYASLGFILPSIPYAACFSLYAPPLWLSCPYSAPRAPSCPHSAPCALPVNPAPSCSFHGSPVPIFCPLCPHYALYAMSPQLSCLSHPYMLFLETPPNYQPPLYICTTPSFIFM